MRVSPQVSWTVEKNGIVLLDRATGTARALAYPQAAVWDLLSRGEPFDRMVSKLAAIVGADEEAAERLIHDAVEAWLAEGLLDG